MHVYAVLQHDLSAVWTKKSGLSLLFKQGLVVQGYVEMFNGMANFSWDFNTPSYYFSVIDLMELDNEINNIGWLRALWTDQSAIKLGISSSF